jgi:hypothetical protein
MGIITGSGEGIGKLTSGVGNKFLFVGGIRSVENTEGRDGRYYGWGAAESKWHRLRHFISEGLKPKHLEAIPSRRYIHIH